MNIKEDRRFLALSSREQPLAEQKANKGENIDEILRPDFWKGRRRLRVIAMHELGHATVARMRGWYVSIISVVREGNVLGYVKSIPDSNRGGIQLLKDKIALCFGGMLMEQRIGHNDHRGASSDMAQARYAANILASHLGGSPSNYLEEGKEVAKNDLNNFSMSSFEDSSESLMEVGQKAA